MEKSILESVHESAKDLFEADMISPTTMREFDVLCLPKVDDYSAAKIKAIRLSNNVSQSVFAAYLNTSVATVRKWEARGNARKRPNGAASKLISLIEIHGIGLLGADDDETTGNVA